MDDTTSQNSQPVPPSQAEDMQSSQIPSSVAPQASSAVPLSQPNPAGTPASTGGDGSSVVPTLDAQIYQQNPVQPAAQAPVKPSNEVAQRVASWYEPSTDIPAEQPNLVPQPQVPVTPTSSSAPSVPQSFPTPVSSPVPNATQNESPVQAVPTAPVTTPIAPWEIPSSPVASPITPQQEASATAPSSVMGQPVSQQGEQITPPEQPIQPSVQQESVPLQEHEVIQPEAAAVSPAPAMQEVQQTGGASNVPPTPPTAPQLFPEEEAHHGLVPKPLRLILGILAVFVVGFILLKVISGMFQGGSSGKVNLTYWGLWEDTNVMQNVISDFERENPNIHVTYVKEDPKEYDERVLTRIHDGNGPDIFRYHVTWLPEMQPVLLPLSKDVLSKDDLTKNYYPFIRNDIVKNGAVYGLPLGIDTLAMFVNKSLFDKAKVEVPSTWDTFITVARGLTEKDATGKIKVAGASIGTYDNITHAPDLMSLLFVQNGVDLSTMSPTQNASDALTFYSSFAKDQTSVWDDTLDPSQLGFARGNVAIYFGYSWDVLAIKAANPNLDFKVYPVPHLPGRNTTIASYWVEGVSAKSKHPREAMLFMKYLAKKDTLTKLYAEESKTRLFGELYPRMDLADSLKDNAYAAPFIEQATNAESSFFAGETHDKGINAQMNQYIGNAIRSVLKDTSPQTAVETLTQGVAQVLQQYGQQQQQ